MSDKGYSAGGQTWEPPQLDPIPQIPLQVAWVTKERLEKLAQARRNGLGDFGWATLGGFVASLPAAIHDLADAYGGEHPAGLTAWRLIDVAIAIGFFAAFAVSFFIERDREPARKVLNDILTRRN
jgi:hypothetical protein